MNIYELYGRAVEKFEEEAAGHRNTVKILADLKAKRLRLDQLEVDESDHSWKAFPGREPPQPEIAPAAAAE